eukprot:CAMPEP_0180725480 /NCGR_PEP_ID=MMETSP1038_2-20121128/18063_1 /TAXON_ID=632150 /ORGANISM="Azadinium spinosum, Strain 3D9" /LENGTH=393 /DNA_ID=CAMNT_0022758085 /DNA_START=19 /DNA_END=1201 /DNA_ORIENTATION=+
MGQGNGGACSCCGNIPNEYKMPLDQAQASSPRPQQAPAPLELEGERKASLPMPQATLAQPDLPQQPEMVLEPMEEEGREEWGKQEEQKEDKLNVLEQDAAQPKEDVPPEELSGLAWARVHGKEALSSMDENVMSDISDFVSTPLRMVQNGVQKSASMLTWRDEAGEDQDAEEADGDDRESEAPNTDRSSGGGGSACCLFGRRRSSGLSLQTRSEIQRLFSCLDVRDVGEISREDAISYFKGRQFSKVIVNAMFNEVDFDGNDTITAHEFESFWQQVVTAGYSESQVRLEISKIIEGGAWVDWKDSRDVGRGGPSVAARRPSLDGRTGEMAMTAPEAPAAAESPGWIRKSSMRHMGMVESNMPTEQVSDLAAGAQGCHHGRATPGRQVGIIGRF